MSKDVETELEIGDKSFVQGDDNVIQPFQLDSSNLRGRVVRVGSVINDVLVPHGYPNPVAHLVAETMVVALLLSSMLKYDGVFTLQARGDGPINTLVADVTKGAEVRGCATFEAERLQQSRELLLALKTEETSQNHLAQYLGKGYLAFTVDQGTSAERYQGVVDLKGASIVDCVQHYFNQSDQIGNGIKMSVGERADGWRAGAIMLQHMTEDEQNIEAGTGNLYEDDWRRAMILMGSCTDDELLNPALHSNELLARLFHEEGVRVFDPILVTKGCRCNTEKVKNILFTMPEDDIDHMANNGTIEMRCEFCSRDFVFDLNDIRITMPKDAT